MKKRILIHRTNHADNFVKIACNLAQDYDVLSASAFGWLVRLISRPADWSINLGTLVCRHHQYYAVRMAILELRQAGFVIVLNCRREGRFGTTEYHVFDSPQSAEQIAALCAQEGGVLLVPKAEAVEETTVSQKSTSGTASQFSACGKSNTTKIDTNKERYKRIVPKGTIPAAEPAGFIPDEDTGLNASDLALAGVGEDSMPLNQAQAGNPASDTRQDLKAPHSGGGGESLALVSEDEPDGKTFPWRQIMGALGRIVPEVKMPTAGARRDVAMKGFWRAHGKTVGCFELLAEKVKASDYLMARKGHEGNGGRPFSWGWIFSKTEKGELRADAIIEGRYSSEAMGFVLEKKAKDAAPKLTKVMTCGGYTPIEVNLAEIHEGELRYKVYEKHPNGLPLVLDYAS